MATHNRNVNRSVNRSGKRNRGANHSVHRRLSKYEMLVVFIPSLVVMNLSFSKKNYRSTRRAALFLTLRRVFPGVTFETIRIFWLEEAHRMKCEVVCPLCLMVVRLSFGFNPSSGKKKLSLPPILSRSLYLFLISVFIFSINLLQQFQASLFGTPPNTHFRCRWP